MWKNNGKDILTNVKKLHDIKYPDSGKHLEFDLWIPTLNLCLEFQDSYHYTSTWYQQHTQDFIQRKDTVKRVLVNQKGISLIVIPCWWDGTTQTLSAAIHHQRPDLVEFDFQENISLNPPPDFFNTKEIPNIGELMLASFPSEKMNFIAREWWMGEKYDGVRCCWNPDTKNLYTRYGKFVNLQPKMEIQMPQIILDLELWFGRGQFVFSYSLVRDSDLGFNWDSFRTVIFDEPSENLQNYPFEERYTKLLSNIDHQQPFQFVAARLLCEGNEHIKQTTKQIIEGGEGEGIILRKVGSLYEHGRSSSLIKIKNSIGDKEAMVVNILEDNALELKLPNGTTFQVPREDVHLPNTQAVIEGDIVSFSFSEFSRRDVPMKPKVFRIRSDLSWSDVKQSEQFSDSKGNFTSKPIRYWTEVNMKNFMVEYAKDKRLMDPFLADTWYTITSEDIRQEKGGNAILNKFKGGYYHAVQHLFPEIEFDKTKLHGYMANDISNRRIYFEEVAKTKGYDPLVPEPWFMFASKKIVQAIEGGSVLANSKGGYFQSLKLLFPELTLQKDNKSLWQDPKNRKLFFEWYAKQHNFDPSDPDNWYRVSIESVMSLKGARRVLYYHKMSVYQALMDLFPDIGLDKTKFTDNSLWHEPSNRRKFFEDYAKENSFDPQIVSNWYSQPFEQIMGTKGAQGVLFHHENSLSGALCALFPELDLDPSKIQTSKWQNVNAKRQFFEKFAKEQNFDPLIPDNWSPSIRKFLLSFKAIQKMIVFHNNSVLQCLLDIFPELPWKYSLKKYYWRDITARKSFFMKYAQVMDFDPLVSDNWYNVNIYNVLKFKGARGVLFYHDNNVSKALIELFPNVSFDKSKFTEQTKIGRVWASKENRRNFFEKFAKDNNFDYRIPSNWYSQSPDRILAAKGGKSVILYHNSTMQALLDLFPDIALDETAFSTSWMIPRSQNLNRSEELEPRTVSLREAKQVVADHKKLEKKLTKENLPPKNVSNIHRREKMWNEEGKRREFFENYAKQSGFDPLVAEHWYGPLRTNILSIKGIFGVLEHYNKSLIRALMSLFPEIGLEKSKFFKKWFDVVKRRNFFENYAEEKGFDPLLPDNWYTIPKTQVLSLKGIHGIMSYHNNSLTDALVDLFPEIGLDKSKFRYSTIWDSPAKRRQFFDNFAMYHKFDPQIPENWYNVPQKAILSEKGASSILVHHGTLTQALLDLYPNVDFDKSKLFPFGAKWRDPQARRDFFIEYAKEKDFDPLDPSKWYLQKKSAILSKKGAKRVAFYHANSVSKALLELFPEIGLHKSYLPWLIEMNTRQSFQDTS